MDMFRQSHYFRILFALVLGLAASIWVKALGLGSFMSLLISAVLFFGVYGLFLLLQKEEMIVEIWNMLVGKVFKKWKITL